MASAWNVCKRARIVSKVLLIWTVSGFQHLKLPELCSIMCHVTRTEYLSLLLLLMETSKPKRLHHLVACLPRDRAACRLIFVFCTGCVPPRILFKGRGNKGADSNPWAACRGCHALQCDADAVANSRSTLSKQSPEDLARALRSFACKLSARLASNNWEYWQHSHAAGPRAAGAGHSTDKRRFRAAAKAAAAA